MIKRHDAGSVGAGGGKSIQYNKNRHRHWEKDTEIEWVNVLGDVCKSVVDRSNLNTVRVKHDGKFITISKMKILTPAKGEHKCTK